MTISENFRKCFEEFGGKIQIFRKDPGSRALYLIFLTQCIFHDKDREYFTTVHTYIFLFLSNGNGKGNIINKTENGRPEVREFFNNKQFSGNEAKL